MQNVTSSPRGCLETNEARSRRWNGQNAGRCSTDSCGYTVDGVERSVLKDRVVSDDDDTNILAAEHC